MLEVSEAIILPNSKALKIVRKSQQLVADAFEEGLFLFGLYVSPKFSIQET